MVLMQQHLYIGNDADFPDDTPVTTTNILDALVYDTDDADDPGLLVLLNPGQPQVNEGGRGDAPAHSSQRIPNGSGGQRNTDTYDQAYPTPGAMNYPIYTNWTGSINNDWLESGNWDYGVPTILKEVTIADVAKAPSPVISGSAECATLTMNTGSSLVIAPIGSLTVTGTFTNDGSLTIQSDASGTGSLIESSGVNATSELYLTEDKWHYVSAPVDDPTANVFFGLYMMYWEEPTGLWTFVTDPGYVMATDMEGYAIWSESGLTGNTTVSFSGNMNTGPKSIDVTAVGPFENNGYNFAGNPYPSALDWNVDDGSGWSRTAGNVDLSLYIWNQTAGNYGVYVKDGASGTNDVDNIIPPLQGFFVHSSSAAGTLGVDNGARIHDNQNILKTKLDENPYLKFGVTGNNYKDEFIINVNSSATNNFEGQYDATKMMGSEDAPQVYSLSADNLNLSINSIPEISSNLVIPVDLIVGAEGTYILSLDEISGFESTPLYLEDLKQHVVINIKTAGSYSFDASPDDTPARFLLHFSYSDAPSYSYDLTEKQVLAYSYENKVVVSSPELITGTVTVYDLMGREIANENLNRTSYREINMGNNKGYYIVNIVSENGVYNEKIFVK